MLKIENEERHASTRKRRTTCFEAKMKNKTVLFFVFASERQTLCFTVAIFWPCVRSKCFLTFMEKTNENETAAAAAGLLASSARSRFVCVSVYPPL